MMIANILADPEYPAVKKYIIEHTGLEYYLDKDEDLASRIGRRLSVTGIGRLHDYLRRLESSPGGRAETEALAGELTIGETYFFRQRDHFDFLRDRIFPELFERKKDSRTLRIWSAGCATGAEPYSVAMLLRLDLAAAAEGWSISILGTDINTEFLARARQARYDYWAFRDVPEELRNRCFRRDGKQWVLRPEFRQAVSFVYHNLAAGPPSPGGEHFDIILCRNVTIYFGREVVRRVVANFYDALNEGGWLLVGHAEPNAETFSRFATVCEGGTTAYRKTAPLLPPSLDFPTVRVRIPRPAAPPPPAIRPRAPVYTPAPNVDDARAMADRGEWDDAAALCDRLIAAEATNAAAHFTRGLILEHGGAAADAERSLRRAVYLDRGFALAHYHLGICLQQGSPMQARKAFDNVVRLLDGRPDAEVIEHGDGITAVELRELAKMHLELLDGK
jgi:chemotaxis protein methyltransferase CheR